MEAFQMSQWLGRFHDHERDGDFHVIFVGGRNSIGGSFVDSLVGENHARFSAEVQYANPVGFQRRSVHSTIIMRRSSRVEKRRIFVDSVKVTVHHVPALSDATGYKDESYFLAAQRLLSKYSERGLLIFCIDMSDTRLRGSVLRTLQELRPDWSRTVIVLTFTDALPALVRHRDKPDFDKGGYFDIKLGEWIKELKVVLGHIRVQQEVVAKINICPIADEPGDLLPNGEPWLPPLSLAIMEILSPEKKAAFLEEHTALLSTVRASSELPATLSPSVCAAAEHMTATHVGTRTETQSSSVSPVLSNQLQSIRDALSKLGKDCPVFSILVIGRTGVGKSTLINNLLGKEVASVSHTLQSEMPDVSQKYEVTVEGVQIVVYDTPGLGDVKGVEEEWLDLKNMEEVLAQKKIHLVVYCYQMNNTIMTSSTVGALRKYHQIGVDWERSVIALTFADALYVPKRELERHDFKLSQYFVERLTSIQENLRLVLQFEVGVNSDVVKQLKICPTSLLSTDRLPNGNPWYVPLWLDIVGMLSPAVDVHFLDIHRNNISDQQASPSSKHVELELQLTKEGNNRATNTIAIGMDVREILQSLLSFNDLLKLFAPEQAGQSRSEPKQANQTGRLSILSQNVHELKGHLMFLRKHVSRKAVGKGRALLEVLLCNEAEIGACFKDNHLDEEGAVQAGIIKWIGGMGHQPPTWETLLKAMDVANFAQQDVQILEKDLGLSNMSTLSQKVNGFSERECHTLYQKAITDNPTITLHIAKAMTIGPPRVGKTALRYNLLGLPLPEVSKSTPVMKTAETVGILFSDETAAKAEVELIQIGGEDNWVLVSESSGILSLLSHLKEGIGKAKQGQGMQKAAAMNSVQAPSDFIPPKTQFPLTNMQQVTPGQGQHNITKPSADSTVTGISRSLSFTGTSAGATHEDATSDLASELFQLLQTPDIADITLPDAKVLQFLDCGGQLAYHDILPIFTTIPAIYLHVFDLTKDLATCPEDTLCIGMAEGEVFSRAKSPLTVAEMMSRSVMTIKSLAAKTVQLPKGVLLSDPPQPHVAFVGTHLDELDKKYVNVASIFRMTSEALQSSVPLELENEEGIVMRNLHECLPAMFFPVTNMQNFRSEVGSFAINQLKDRIKTVVSSVKVKVPVKWYLYQMLELGKEKPASVHKFMDLYKLCHQKMVVNDLVEFHTMITYFHALGLLIHACNDDAHSEDSTCLIFTDPSYLFENISKLFLVRFMEKIRCGGSLRKLKLEGKLTEKTLRTLKVDSSQLDHKAFMDVLVHFFIGADIEDRSENKGRTLFIPAVLPIEATTQPLRSEQSLHFVIAFNEKPFIPCGIYTGIIARLQSLPQWMISTDSISRSRATFGIMPGDTVHLFDCSSHIRVELHDCDRKKVQDHRDTILTVVSESYCFLFHGKPTRGQPCTTCKEEPYLVLGLTCHHCREMRTNHFAMLEMEDGEAKSVRCQATMNAKKVHEEHMYLFQGIQHDAVVRKQHTSPVSQPTLSRKVMMTMPPQDTAEHTKATSTNSPPHPKYPTQSGNGGMEAILSQKVYEREGYLMLLRKHVSRNASSKGRAVLEGLWLEAAVIEACFGDNPLNEEAAVQAGIIRWIEGRGRQPPTWGVLLEAMDFAGISQQYLESLKKDLGLL